MRINIHLFFASGLAPAGWLIRIRDDHSEELTSQIKLKDLWQIPIIIRRYKPLRWHLSLSPDSVLIEFFWWLGRQNDYLYPPAGSTVEGYPCKGPHLWKTRFGIRTSWDMAKTLHGK